MSGDQEVNSEMEPVSAMSADVSADEAEDGAQTAVWAPSDLPDDSEDAFDDRDVRVPRDSMDAMGDPATDSPGRVSQESKAGDETSTDGNPEADSLSEEVTEFGEQFVAASQPTPTPISAPPDSMERLLDEEGAKDEQEMAAWTAAEEPLDPEGDATELHMNSEHAVAAEKPPSVNSQQAHESFIKALEAHAQSLGLQFIPQAGFFQFLEPTTGHKIYVSRAARETTPVRVETTMELVGRLPGARALEKENGKIAAALEPQLDLVIEALTILASKEMGKVRSPKRLPRASVEK